MTQFHPLCSPIVPPSVFNDPFDYEPHALCQLAAREVMAHVATEACWQSDLAAGKMLGVLVCRDAAGQTGFVAAYSGLLVGRNDWPWFVPPVYDAQQPDGHFKQTERQISALNDEVARLQTLGQQATEADRQRLVELRLQRKQMSEQLQLWLFRQYRVLNARGEQKDLVELWRDHHVSERIRSRFPLPPGGSGDCCAPKLLQFAYSRQLQPLCIAEFWHGQSPRMEIRHHGQFYPACRGKCKPILEFMLQGLRKEEPLGALGPLGPQGQLGPLGQLRPLGQLGQLGLTIVYQEESFVVVAKAAGLLSVPGRTEAPSVASLLRQRFPWAEGPMIVHRLDQDTSGLMVAALTPQAYHHLQQQFLRREVSKRYIALLQPPTPAALSPSSSCLPLSCMSRQCRDPRGIIDLPLRPDPLDRPRQLADPAHGKPAVTTYELLSADPPFPRVALYPHTGRTHQLRMHCAHPLGLGMPIRGDRLYGQPADRLYLHADTLAFAHPLTGKALTFTLPAPF